MHSWRRSIYVSLYDIGYCMCNRLLAMCVLIVVHIYVNIEKLDTFYVSYCVLYYHYILLLIILQYVAFVWFCGTYQMMDCLMLHWNGINQGMCLFV